MVPSEMFVKCLWSVIFYKHWLDFTKIAPKTLNGHNSARFRPFEELISAFCSIFRVESGSEEQIGKSLRFAGVISY